MLTQLLILLTTQTIVIDQVQQFTTSPACFSRPSDPTKCLVFPAKKARDYHVRAKANTGRLRCCFTDTKTKNLRTLTNHPNNVGTSWCFSLNSNNTNEDKVRPTLWPHIRPDQIKTCNADVDDGAGALAQVCFADADCSAGETCAVDATARADRVGAILVCETPSSTSNLRVQVITQ